MFDPIIKFMPAAVPGRYRRLRLARGALSRAIDADVKVLGVAIPRPHLRQPSAIGAGPVAQRLLDRGVDKNARNSRILRSGADQICVRVSPYLWIDVTLILCNDID